jgi:hypothetical protein
MALLQGAPAILPTAAPSGSGSNSLAFGRNLTVIVVSEGNPGRVTGVDAFDPDAGLRTAICGADHRLGNLAALVVRARGIEPDPAEVGSGCEVDALVRVAARELDAALVFRSGLEIPGGVVVINVPDKEIHFGYVPLGGANPGSFAQFLQSGRAKEILRSRGTCPNGVPATLGPRDRGK